MHIHSYIIFLYKNTKDTTYFYEDQSGNITIPDQFSIGMNIGHNKQDKNVWSIGEQLNISNWDIYQEVLIILHQTLRDTQSTEIIFGGRITPSIEFDNKNKNTFQKTIFNGVKVAIRYKTKRSTFNQWHEFWQVYTT